MFCTAKLQLSLHLLIELLSDRIEQKRNHTHKESRSRNQARRELDTHDSTLALRNTCTRLITKA